jgi:predicted glycoside hydrolase/deacetylase ChbG (UPF0249 family)
MSKTTAESLGHKKEDKLLIINADDAGMCHACNQGIERTFLSGLLSSTTVMTPCPWFEDFAARARANQMIKVGVHLTTTSEWKYFRWGPVSPREKVPSLLDKQGYFYETAQEYYDKAVLEEVELEFRAQIEKCLAAGLKPTHLDSHMGIYHFKDEFFELAKTLAKEYKMTLRVGYPPRAEVLKSEGWGVVDKLLFDTHDTPLEDRRQMYYELLTNLEPGCTELVIHPAEPYEELKAIGGMWQRRGFDLEFFSNLETRELVENNNIIIIGYDQLQQLTYQTVN